MKMIVTRREIRYGDKAYRRGQTVEIKPQHVRVLTLLKKVEHPPGAPLGHVATTQPLFAAAAAPDPAHDVRDAATDPAQQDTPAAAEPTDAQPGAELGKAYRTRRLKAED